MGEYSRTGAAIVPLSGGGTIGHIYTKVGVVIAPLAAKGTESKADHPLNGITRQWQRSIVGSGVWTDIQGATGLNYVIVTADKGCLLRVIEYDRNYLGVASAPASATDPVFVADQGTSESVFAGGGTDADTSNRKGGSTAVLVARGGRVLVHVPKTGAALAALVGGGSRILVHAAKTGVALSEFVGRGSKA